MKIRHRIVYDKTDINPTFIRFLKDHNANIQEDETDLVVAYIVEKEEEEWRKEFERLLDREDLSSIAESIYSKSEMKNATWYTIRPTYRWEYPQPEDEYVETTFDTTHYCEGCGCGLRQKQEFKVKKNPKWGKRNFLMLHWIEDELFVTNHVVDTLKENGLKGFEIYDVLKSIGDEPLNEIKQIHVQRTLEPALINLEQSVNEVMACRRCGSIKYIYTGRGFKYNKDAFNNIEVDIIKTSEKFGDGHMCASNILISKNLYNVLVLNSLEKHIEFEPIFFD